MPNNVQSNEAVLLALLRLSVVPPLPLLGGKIEGEPLDLLSLSKAAAFYKVDKQALSLFVILPSMM